MNRGAKSGYAKHAIERSALVLLALALASCGIWHGGHGGYRGHGATRAAETICVEPRPEVCTMDYRPVCARLESGERRTYSNACGACADPEVAASVPGACE